MSSAFLLRFQESCLTTESAAANAPTTKTATKTYVRSEQNDVDAIGDHSTSIPRQNLQAEMKTQTRIHKEETDLHRRAASVLAFSDTPVVCAVSRAGTKTKKPREQADRFFESNWQSVPIADARMVGAARIATAIRSAADDRDLGKAVPHAIRRCS